MTSFPKAMSFSELMETSCPQPGPSGWPGTSASWTPSVRDLNTLVLTEQDQLGPRARGGIWEAQIFPRLPQPQCPSPKKP